MEKFDPSEATREELVDYLESWGFACYESETLEELRAAALQNQQTEREGSTHLIIGTGGKPFTVLDVMREEAAKCGKTVDKKDAEWILWEQTGYPCFWPDREKTPEENLRMQLHEFFSAASVQGLDACRQARSLLKEE